MSSAPKSRGGARASARTATRVPKSAARAPKKVEPGRAAARSKSSAEPQLLNIGYGNLVLASRIVAIVSPQSSPMRRLREEASERGKLVDATQGRRTRSILVTDSDHVILSAINPETIAARLGPGDAFSGP